MANLSADKKFRRAVVLRALCANAIAIIVLCIARIFTPDDQGFSLVTGAIAFAITLVYVYLFPFERTTPTPLASRISTVAMALIGLGATIMVPTVNMWFIAVLTAAGILVVCAFLFELLRKTRQQLIISISSVIYSGAIALCASGWGVFGQLKNAIDMFSNHPVFSGITTGLILLAIIGLITVLSVWPKNFDGSINQNTPLASNESQWVAAALIPTLIAGVIPAVLSWTIAILGL